MDIGGTKTEIALVDKGKIIKIEKFKTPHTKEKFLEEITDRIKKIKTGKIEGVGISIASPVFNGKVLNPPHLPLKNFDLKTYLAKRLKTKVEVENDANCFAIAELTHGYGKNYKNFVLVAVGTGIGGGIVIDGKLYAGKGAAGEIGHMIIDSEGKDKWGIKGAFEGLASGDALVKMSKKIMGREYRATELAEMAGKRNKKAKLVLDSISHNLGRGFVSITNILDPDAIILSGGVMECGEIILHEAKKEMKKYTMMPPAIRVSRIKKGAIIGASELIR